MSEMSTSFNDGDGPSGPSRTRPVSQLFAERGCQFAVDKYLTDRSDGLTYFKGKGYPNYGLTRDETVTALACKEVYDITSDANDKATWEDAWGGGHLVLDGFSILNQLDGIANTLVELGRSHQGLKNNLLAGMYLELACHVGRTNGFAGQYRCFVLRGVHSLLVGLGGLFFYFEGRKRFVQDSGFVRVPRGSLHSEGNN